MRYGFYHPTGGPAATRDGILALAREASGLACRKSAGSHSLRDLR
jgi:hypothetical protein